MNSSEENDDECFIMDNKPIITCAGDSTLWKGLENALVQAVPQEAAEWRRSLGRPLRSVHVSASFVPFSISALPLEGNWDLIRRPILHIYWTECTDTDVYKATVREELENWLKELNQRNIIDWMIVVVETYDVKRANKLLPRQTVLDKIRSDFALKQGDRCLSVINPMRAEFRSAESWRGLVSRIRVLLLHAYNHALSQLEDHVREQRERRNQPSWNFCEYFLLQEELALVLEMLGLYDEALVQYDELDALFTQFVVNAHMGETRDWLARFQRPIEQWRALILGRPLTREQRSAVLANGAAPLLEFRAYLFSRQAAMLLLLCKPWEVAQRCLPFLHTCVRELDLLDVTVPQGALPCWLFLGCLEVLHTCEKYNDSDQVEAYSQYTADLWAYAREKLQILGQLCGLLPGSEPTSEQLHLVVGLSAGMGDCPGTIEHPTPTDKLKEALCSKDAFYKHYLELAELAMGTYKHIGRIRSARLIGRELASFYLLQGHTQNAIVFLTDTLRMFEEEHWRDLTAQTQLELASCYSKQHDQERYILACVAIASAPELELLVRNFYFDEMIKLIKTLSEENVMQLSTSLGDAFKIINIDLKNCTLPVIQDTEIEIDLEIESNFPREVFCTSASLSIEFVQQKNAKEANYCSYCNYNDMQPQDDSLKQLKIMEHFDRKQDGQIGSANVACKHPDKDLKSDVLVNSNVNTSFTLENNNIPLKPGLNSIKLKWKANNPGSYKLLNLTLDVEKIKFKSENFLLNLGLNVVRQEPTIRLEKLATEFIAGLEQYLKLTIINGSYHIKKDSYIKLRTSKGLMIQIENLHELKREITLHLPEIIPFERVTFNLRFMCDLPPKKDDKHIEHKINIQCSWSNEEKVELLHYSPLFKSSWRLHTAHIRKFVQITITGLVECNVLLKEPLLQCKSLKLKSLNNMKGQPLIVRKNSNVSFMWELIFDNAEDTEPVKAEFIINYKILDAPYLVHNVNAELISYKFFFDIINYKTLFVIKSCVEPSKGNEFCRSGTMCHLRLSVSRVNLIYTGSLMYEVLADQTMWAVCGRTAGVVALDNEDPQNVTLDVMPLTSGHMPLPTVRLSKYIPAEQSLSDKIHKIEPNTHPRLEPFSAGQVYNYSKAQQVHVLAPVSETSGV